MAGPRVAIIGGGMGGLSLLVTLNRLNIPATLYERDASFGARAHLGGSLDLHYHTGQRTLRENGLEAQFREHIHPEEEGMRIFNPEGQLLWSDEGGPPPGHAPPEGEGGSDLEHRRPEIDRTVLRQLILDACKPESIRWGYGLASVKAVGSSGQHELTFSNGEIVTCDVLVGADGAHSRIRPLVSKATARYEDLNGAEISIAPAISQSEQAKEITEKLSRGMTFLLGHRRSLFTHFNHDNRIRAYVWLVGIPESWSLPKEPAAAKKALLDPFEGWAPWIRKIIELCDPDAIYPRALYALPVGHRWDHVKGVTLLGDAAHLMTPFAGEGANLAMIDGLELGYAIAEGVKSGDVDVALAKYEKEMCDRAEGPAKESHDNMELLTLHEDSAERAAKWFADMFAQGPPPA